ncbi:MAG: 16S rRNA (adenine(1518)-N(6)/adenine(1519)-N(6))-dimethyltransferase [Lachnospiraceae bacterium]|nr:16S rRNA (adenine(1518)-N(6)/adenine(1519)-N(6))-dimethyltransferase [Lachnospiraceae bacterium]
MAPVGYEGEKLQEKLSNPRRTIEILQKYSFSFHKKLGQNFLIDEHVINKIIASAGITKDDMVIEIGPGIGTLTQYLAEAAGNVVAVELDSKLLPILDETLSDYSNVTVINADILDLDLEDICSKYSEGRTVKVAANLPYYITTPIIMALLEGKAGITSLKEDEGSGPGTVRITGTVPEFESITVMVQKEVALRMQASPGSKDYGALSLAVQYYSEPYLAANVPRNSFIPRPNVDSAVVRLLRRKDPPVTVSDPALMFRIIRAAFMQRRKTLANSIANRPELSFSRDAVKEALNRTGLPENVRGEALDLTQFAALTCALTEADENGRPY